MKFWFPKKKSSNGQSGDSELQAAQIDRINAERQLREARRAAREVRSVAIEAMTIRKDNQFSQRIAEAFGRPRTNG